MKIILGLIIFMILSSCSHFHHPGRSISSVKEAKSLNNFVLIWDSKNKDLKSLSLVELHHRYNLESTKLNEENDFLRILERAQFLSSDLAKLLDEKILDLDSKFKNEKSVLIMHNPSEDHALSLSLPPKVYSEIGSLVSQSMVHSVKPNKLNGTLAGGLLYDVYVEEKPGVHYFGKGIASYSELDFSLKASILLHLALKDVKDLEYDSIRVRKMAILLMADNDLKESDKDILKDVSFD